MQERDEALVELENAITSESEARELLSTAQDTAKSLENELARKSELLETAETNLADLEFIKEDLEAEKMNLKSLMEKKDLQVHTLTVQAESLKDKIHKLELTQEQAKISRNVMSENVMKIASDYKRSDISGEVILLRGRVESLQRENAHLKSGLRNSETMVHSFKSQNEASRRMLRLGWDKTIDEEQYQKASVATRTLSNDPNSNNNIKDNQAISDNIGNRENVDHLLELEKERHLRIQAESYSSELISTSQHKQQQLKGEIIELKKELLSCEAKNAVSNKIIMMEDRTICDKQGESESEISRLRMECNRVQVELADSVEGERR